MTACAKIASTGERPAVTREDEMDDEEIRAV